MKKLIIAAILMTGMASFAQDTKDLTKKDLPKREKAARLTPEQRLDLRVKKMTLDLDLNASQQKEVRSLLAQQQAETEKSISERKAAKESGKQPTADDLYKRKSQQLDHQIAHKAKLKKILSEEQYAKWENNQQERKEKFNRKIVKHGHRGDKAPKPSK